ncbi:MAG: DUF2125 domain-containing protein [Methylocapsa sp.]|nr:DUF2125 domain-containing protein [Methylocapsa sp.]
MNSPSTLRQRLRAHSWLIILVGMVAMAPIGWSGFWYVKSRAAAAALAAWMEKEAQAGRQWSCPSQKITGFPYTVVISCENAQFQGEAFGKQLTGTLHGLRATSPLLRNDNLLVKLEPPFAATSSSGDLDINAQWSELLVEIEGTPGALGQIAFMGSQLRLQGTAAGSVVSGTAIGDILGSIARSPARRDQAFDVTFSFHQGLFPALNSFLGTDSPIATQFEATIEPFVPSGPTLAEALEKWRAASGRLDVTFASLTGGPVAFDARGGLGIDGEHRVEGKLDAHFAGLAKALRRLDVDPDLLSAGQIISGLLGDSSEGLKLPVTFADGFLRIGPVRTGIAIPPLY